MWSLAITRVELLGRASGASCVANGKWHRFESSRRAKGRPGCRVSSWRWHKVLKYATIAGSPIRPLEPTHQSGDRALYLSIYLSTSFCLRPALLMYWCVDGDVDPDSVGVATRSSSSVRCLEWLQARSFTGLNKTKSTWRYPGHAGMLQDRMAWTISNRSTTTTFGGIVGARARCCTSMKEEQLRIHWTCYQLEFQRQIIIRFAGGYGSLNGGCISPLEKKRAKQVRFRATPCMEQVAFVLRRRQHSSPFWRCICPLWFSDHTHRF
jgi:hypothetical protein